MDYIYQMRLKVFNKYNIRLLSGISETLQKNLVYIKDKILKDSKSICVYKIKYPHCYGI